MSLPNVNVVRSQGAVVRPALSDDTISGMIFYSNKYPSGFSASNQVKVVTSAAQAYDLGFVDDFSDGVIATASFTVTSAMLNDTLTIDYTNTLLNASYTFTNLTDDTTSSANKIVNGINNQFNTTGISAVLSPALSAGIAATASLLVNNGIYNSNLNVVYPTGFSFSLTDINAGDGASGTASLVVTTEMTSNDLNVSYPTGFSFSITGIVGSPTASAISIASKINALSNGISATSSVATVTLTASGSLFGGSLNGLTPSVTGQAASKVTLGLFGGGSDGSTTASATSIATKINALSNGILATATASTVLLTATNSVFGSDLNNSTPVVTGSASTKVTLGNFNGGLVKQSTIVLSAPSSTLDRIVGAKINGVTPVETGTGASKLTAGPWTGGVSPFTTVWKYHIDEYFRLGKGQLWIGVFPVPNNFDFNEIVTVQNAALGQIRQIGIFKSGDDMTTYSATDTTAIQAKCNTLSTARRPLVVILQPNIKLVTDFNSLPNLNQYSNTNVSVVIGQDGANAGKKLYDIYGYTVGMLGATLGCLSTFRVSESIGWVAKQLSLPFSTAEYDTAAFGNGVEYKTLNSTDLDLLADKNYTFIRKFEGLAGSFISDSKTAVSNTSDFFSLERNRTIDKARRLTYTALVPFVNSPLEVDSTGKLSALTIAIFTQTINTQLTTMTSAGELSGFQVVIDPNQNVTATDTININLFLQPIGVARFVEVKVSFTVAAVTTT